MANVTTGLLGLAFLGCLCLISKKGNIPARPHHLTASDLFPWGYLQTKVLRETRQGPEKI